MSVFGPEGQTPANYYTTVQYQWQKLVRGAWTDLEGETNMTLTFAGAGVDTEGTYRCRVNVLTRADALYITAYTRTVEVMHAKRTSVVSEVSVNDAPGGGVELYAKVINPHSDSATIPAGYVTFNLVSGRTGETYQNVVFLDASGVANHIVEQQLPEGMYSVTANYSGSYIFKASSGTAMYLSEIGSG